MGEKALVEGLISEAIALVHTLDATGDSPTLAAWYFYDDVEEWRLLIASPSFDKCLPKQEPLAYQKIAEAVSSAKLDSLSISLVKVVRTDSPLPKAIRLLVGTGPTGVVQAHFTDTTLNGIFIKEMIILRSA